MEERAPNVPLCVDFRVRMMDRGARLPPRKGEKLSDSQACLCLLSSQGDSLKRHHITEKEQCSRITAHVFGHFA